MSEEKSLSPPISTIALSPTLSSHPSSPSSSSSTSSTSSSSSLSSVSSLSSSSSSSLSSSLTSSLSSSSSSSSNVEPLPTSEEEVYTVIGTIYSGNSTYVTRASHGDKTYIVKSNVKLMRNSKKIRKYFKEYTIGSSIHSQYVAKYCNFKRLGQGFAIIMEDIGGVPLNSVIPLTGFDVSEFLDIALQIVEGLDAIHKAKVTHRDINSSNIVINMQTKELNIIDFGKSSQRQVAMSAQTLTTGLKRRGSKLFMKGTYVYISPEQTGRINTTVDYRADIYSLGVTFYEMLTGATPFGRTDPLDLIYKHMAVHPEPLDHVKPEIGTAMSAIVSKMLAKNPEDRYQDCRSLMSDLLTVQKSIETKTPLQDFVAGTHDLWRQLKVSQKLYGRDKEVGILTNNFKLICERSPEASTLVLIHGASGIGKTRIVHEVYKPLTKQNGYYVCGKFEQFTTPTPLSALVQAIRQLVQHILTESEESLLSWKEHIQHGVGENGQLVVDIIPELELIIGPQSPVKRVGTIETIHRFNCTICSCIFSLAAIHPLIVLLDDLQWADSNTFSFLTTLLDPSSSRDPNYLFVVGCYRDNEVPPQHPLKTALHEVKKKGGKVVDILLEPLNEFHIMQLLEDTFNSHTREPSLKVDTQALGRLVYKKTQGNPFFINKLLVTLHKDKHIKSIECDGGVGWECDMEAIQMANYTSNVVDLMITTLRRFPENVQNMMGMAAIIGNQFKLTLLARVCSLPEHYVEASLRSAVQEGFLIPSTDEVLCPTLEGDVESGEIVLINADKTQMSPRNPIIKCRLPTFVESSTTLPSYYFAHDRIQQAAACLLSREEQLKAHLRLAEVSTLFDQTIPPSRDLPALDPQKIGEELDFYLPFNIISAAYINYMAAVKARDINAFHTGQGCSNECIRLLEIDVEKNWKNHYELCMDAYKLQADLQCTTLILTAPRCDHLLSRAKTNVEKADIYMLLHRRYEAENNMSEALDTAIKGLGLLGVNFPESEKEQEQLFLADIKLLRERITLENVGNLLDLPDCTDKLQLLIFKLLSTAWISAFMRAKVFLSGLIATRSVLRTLDYGACGSTGKFFCTLGVAGSLYMNDYPLVNEIAKVGITIGDTRFSYDKSESGCVYSFYATGIATYIYPLRDVMKYLYTAEQLYIQGGDTLWRTYIAFQFIENPIFYGANLKEIYDNEFQKVCLFWKEGGMRKLQMRKLADAAALPLYELTGKEIDLLQGEKLEDSVYHKTPMLKCGYNFANGVVSYYLRKRENLLSYADVATELGSSCFAGLYQLVEVEMMAGLVYIDWLGRTPLAWKKYSRKSMPDNRVPWENSEYQSEENLDINIQEANLKRRLKQIGSNIRHFMVASKYCCTNFFHKAYLLRAEFARIALSFNSNEIYDVADILDISEHETVPCNANSRSFEEAMAFYECAIESAQKFGFQQYEALALELYGQFWMSTPPKPHLQFAYMYLHEALIIYEQWGATSKVLQLHDHIAFISAFEPRLNRIPKKTKMATVSSLDLDVIVQAAQTISSQVDFDTLVIRMVKAIVEHANAQRGTFFIGDEDTGKVSVCAEYDYELKPADSQMATSVLETDISLLQPKVPLTKWSNGPQSVVNYVCRTLQPLVLKCAYFDSQFGSDDYIACQQVKSVLCLPILLKNSLKGVMYLENNLCDNLFDQSRVDLLKVLTSQMAISLENIRFLHDQMEKQSQQIIYEHLQKEEKAQRERADAAEKYKMQLENFIDMICHEIRNPLNGIFGNTDLILTYLSSLHDLLYKTNPEAEDNIESLHGSPEFAELEDKSDTGIMKYILEQVIQSTESIQKCAEHQKCMTDDVLHLSRLRSHKLNVTSSFYSPWDTVSTALNIFKPQAESKGLYLKVNSEADYSRVELLGDSVRVYQIISNFLSNSLKFTHTGGITILLSIKEDPSLACSSLSIEKPSPKASPGAPLLCSAVECLATLDNSIDKKTIMCVLKIGVKDTGIGMTAEEQSRLFKRFSQANFRTAQEYGGSGKLAKLMKGTISMESEVGQGSTFTLTLPCLKSIVSSSSSSTSSLIKPCSSLLPDPSSLSSSSSSSSSHSSLLHSESTSSISSNETNSELSPSFSLSDSCASLSSVSSDSISPMFSPTILDAKYKRILVAEDNIVNQNILKRVLKLKGFIVEVADNGREALDKFKQNTTEGTPFGFVLMDMMMPVMDGMMSSTLIRKFEDEKGVSKCKIIGLSGNARDEYRQNALNAGMDEYITKPYHKEMLYKLLEIPFS